MKAIVINKEVVTRMTLGKGRVLSLLANARRRWLVDYIHTLWYVEAMEKDLGSDYIVEEVLDETKKKLHRLEHHLGFDKKEMIEPDWESLDP